MTTDVRPGGRGPGFRRPPTLKGLRGSEPVRIRAEVAAYLARDVVTEPPPWA